MTFDEPCTGHFSFMLQIPARTAARRDASHEAENWAQCVRKEGPLEKFCERLNDVQIWTFDEIYKRIVGLLAIFTDSFGVSRRPSGGAAAQSRVWPR